MFRFSLLVGISLLVYGVSSKPRSTWVKVDDTAVQETVMAESEDKRPMGMKEVEPPEDMDVPDMDIDPSMLIWKAVQESRRRAIDEAGARASSHGHVRAHAIPEEDRDARYHIPEAQLTQKNQDAQRDPVPAYGASSETHPRYDQAEPDLDKVYHTFPNSAASPSQWVEEESDPLQQELVIPRYSSRVRYDQAEVDRDDLYHGKMGHTPVEAQLQVGQGEMTVPGHKGHAFPEVDLDDLYHGNKGQESVETQVQVVHGDKPVPSNREYALPEVDLDDLYHK